MFLEVPNSTEGSRNCVCDSKCPSSDLTYIKIPKNSFTAYRLLYATPRQIGEASRIQFVGSIPDKWFLRKSIPSAHRFLHSSPFVHSKQRQSTLSEKIENSAKHVLSDAIRRSDSPLDDSRENLSKFSTWEDSKLFRKQEKIRKKQLKQLNAHKRQQKIRKIGANAHNSETINIQTLAPEPVSAEEEKEIMLDKNSAFKKQDRHLIGKAVGKGLQKASDYRKDVWADQRVFLSKILGKYQVGELVKVEKILIQVKIASNIRGREVTDANSQGFRILERWKEYFVAVRSTGDYEMPLVIQFYTNRTIKKNDKRVTKGDLKDIRFRRKTLDFGLDIQTCTLSMYNPEDMTIALTVPSEEIPNGSRIYLFKSSSQSAALDWYAFLKVALKIEPVKGIKVHIPDLRILLDLELPLREYEKVFVESEETQDVQIGVSKLYGYKLQRKTCVAFVIDLALKELEKFGTCNKEVRDWLKKADSSDFRVGLAWRLYDKLAWVEDNNRNFLAHYQVMNSSHVLEMRFITHCPTNAITLQGTAIPQPAAMEGFLRLYTTKTGESKKHTTSKYFFSNGQFLFFCSHTSGLPPLPELFAIEGDRLTKNRTVSHQKDLSKTLNIFWPNDKNQIQWLNESMSDNDFKYHENLALMEAKRNVYLLLMCQGAINLAEIAHIEEDPTDKSTFVLIIHRRRVTLKADSPETRSVWMERLQHMSEYWKLRHSEDVLRLKYLKEKNMALLNIREGDEADFVANAASWELSKGKADPQIYNINSLALLRFVIHSGELYQKPRKHSNFEKYYVILIPGYLLLFQMFTRSRINNGSFFNVTYKHHSSIPLESCYIYTGQLTAVDLLLRDKSFDINNPGSHSLPKVYLDGWRSKEDEITRCFTIWEGAKRIIAKHGGKRKAKLTLANRLGRKGKSMVFMARSRQEKDLWVSSILNEAGRFSGSAEGEFSVV